MNVLKVIVVDTNGLYFTNTEWNRCWSRDPDNAEHFNSESEARIMLGENPHPYYLLKGVLPFEYKKIYTHEKHGNKKR